MNPIYLDSDSDAEDDDDDDGQKNKTFKNKLITNATNSCSSSKENQAATMSSNLNKTNSIVKKYLYEDSNMSPLAPIKPKEVSLKNSKSFSSTSSKQSKTNDLIKKYLPDDSNLLPFPTTKPKEISSKNSEYPEKQEIAKKAPIFLDSSPDSNSSTPEKIYPQDFKKENEKETPKSLQKSLNTAATSSHLSIPREDHSARSSKSQEIIKSLNNRKEPLNCLKSPARGTASPLGSITKSPIKIDFNDIEASYQSRMKALNESIEKVNKDRSKYTLSPISASTTTTEESTEPTQPTQKQVAKNATVQKKLEKPKVSVVFESGLDKYLGELMESEHFKTAPNEVCYVFF